MKRIVLFIVLLGLLSLHAQGEKTKKIMISKLATQKDAKVLYDKLSNDDYVKTVSYDYELLLDLEESPAGYFVVLKPFHNEDLLNVILKRLRESYPSAYIKKYFDNSPDAKPYVLGPLPKKRESKKEEIVPKVVPVIEEKIIEKLPEPTVQKHVEPEVPKDYSQYLRKNSKVEEDKTPLYIFVIGGVLLVAFLVMLMMKLRRKTDESRDLDEILFQEAPKQEALAENVTFEALKVDIHSHLIPGVDDGAQSVEDSILLVQRLKKLGYTKIITTPHTMMHRFPNSTETIMQGFKTLQMALLKKQIEMEIEVASEYYLDEHLMALVEKRDVLTFGDNYLLFEMSYVAHPVEYEKMITKMIDAGYKPVLAHPERYLYLGNNFDKYVTLRVLGVYFQVNINSIGGYYSPEVQKNALRLLDEGMVSFLGSDTHKLRHIETLEQVLQSSEYRDAFRKNTILNNTLGHL